jgi:hypothetical protein
MYDETTYVVPFAEPVLIAELADADEACPYEGTANVVPFEKPVWLAVLTVGIDALDPETVDGLSPEIVTLLGSGLSLDDSCDKGLCGRVKDDAFRDVDETDDSDVDFSVGVDENLSETAVDEAPRDSPDLLDRFDASDLDCDIDDGLSDEAVGVTVLLLAASEGFAGVTVADVSGLDVGFKDSGGLLDSGLAVASGCLVIFGGSLIGFLDLLGAGAGSTTSPGFELSSPKARHCENSGHECDCHASAEWS